MKILDEERFKNVNYHKTDVRKTFARVRREQKEAKEQQESAAKNVTQLTRRSNG